jgi:hypothetical protein
MSNSEWDYHHHEGDWSVRGRYEGDDNIQVLYRGEIYRTFTCPGYRIWNFAAHLHDNIPELECERASRAS